MLHTFKYSTKAQSHLIDMLSWEDTLYFLFALQQNNVLKWGSILHARIGKGYGHVIIRLKPCLGKGMVSLAQFHAHLTLLYHEIDPLLSYTNRVIGIIWNEVLTTFTIMWSC